MQILIIQIIIKKNDKKLILLLCILELQNDFFQIVLKTHSI